MNEYLRVLFEEICHSFDGNNDSDDAERILSQLVSLAFDSRQKFVEAFCSVTSTRHNCAILINDNPIRFMVVFVGLGGSIKALVRKRRESEDEPMLEMSSCSLPGLEEEVLVVTDSI